jgi:general secretion pathway protein E
LSEQHIIAALGLERAVLERAARIAERTHQSLLITLSEMGEVSDNALITALTAATGLELQSLFNPSEGLAFPAEAGFLQHFRVLPLEYDDEAGWLVGLVDPTHEPIMAGLRFALGDTPFRSVIIAHEAYKRHMTAHHEGGDATELADGRDIEEQLALMSDQDRNAPIVQFLSSWLRRGVSEGASDIHFETRKSALHIRLRVDGLLRNVAEESRELAGPLMARIRVIAGLDLDSRNRPQDGRTQIVVAGRPIDLRISIVPSSEGSSAVLRLLDRPEALLSLEGLGFRGSHRQAIATALQAKDGLMLFCGPTGSGKTTSLYACLHMLKTGGLKLVSAEDPIEYRFDHVTQVAVNDDYGSDFPTLLRAFLRHDPDVMMIGEIRDRETALIALQAALTGHLVLASLHAMDVARASDRLVQLGLERDQIKASHRPTIAQRLVRRLCVACRSERTPRQAERSTFEHHHIDVPDRVYEAKGCAQCSHTGYRGRVVVAECSGAHQTLLQDALMKVGEGIVSFDEVYALTLDSKTDTLGA